MTGLKIEIAGGILHLRGYSEEGAEAESAALILRVLSDIATKPEILAKAFEVSPAALNAALTGTLLDREVAKLASFRGEPQ